MKTSLKLIALSSSLFFTTTVLAKSNEYQDMQKQLAVIGNVLKTTIAQQEDKKSFRIRAVESTYLAGQGAVLTIHSSGSGFNLGGFSFPDYDFNFDFNFGNNAAPLPPKAPVQPAAPVADVESINEDRISEIVDSAIEVASEAYERAMEEFSENREYYRELKEKERELAYEMRDAEREKRNLEFQARRDQENKEELNREIEVLKKQVEELKSRKNEYAKSAKTMIAKQQEVKEKREALLTEYYAGLENKVAEGLCLYGNGLKALPRNENVSVILKQAGEKEGNRQKDKIMVFSQADIKKCIVDDINSKDLLAKAKKYEF